MLHHVSSSPPLSSSFARPHLLFGTASFGTNSAQAKFQSAETAQLVLDLLRRRGITHLDTARAYPVGSPGTSEALLGRLSAPRHFTVSTKVASFSPGAHSARGIEESVERSLEALGVGKVEILYLHAPDRSTGWEETCRAVDAQWRKGRFERFGLSNFKAEEVEAMVGVCEREGLVRPSVYQGRYNAVVRGGEEELFPVLRRYGIAFFAYSPTAVGLFSGSTTSSMNTPGSRWDTSTPMGKNYSSTYLKPSILGATQRVADAAKTAGLDGHALALRWTIYHSRLDGKYGDAVVLGASSLKQLEANLDAADAGPLEEDMVKMVEGVWEVVKGEGEAAPYYL